MEIEGPVTLKKIDLDPLWSEHGITDRETEILYLVVHGWDNAQIATSLFIDISTVKTHINAMFRKFAITKGRSEIVARFWKDNRTGWQTGPAHDKAWVRFQNLEASEEVVAPDARIPDALRLYRLVVEEGGFRPANRQSDSSR